MNYFDFYGFPVKFNLDEQALKAKYLELIKLNHPDFFIGNALKHKAALLSTSINNEAYKCLSNIHLRAAHALEHSAYTFDEALPADFLMQMMELNERLDDLKQTCDHVEIHELSREIGQFTSSIELEFKRLANEADENESHHELQCRAIKTNLLKRKYLLRLSETLANIAVL